LRSETKLSRSRRHICLALCLFSVLALQVGAQELEISVSPSPVGSGARAAGMADAFVAIADDATAASWNPAGLVQLERPEVSIVGSFNAAEDEFSAFLHDEVHAKHSDDNYDLNYFSIAYPVPFLVLGRNACVALNYQRKYDFSRSFDLEYYTAFATSRGTPLTMAYHMDFEQEGGLSALTPAFAIELTHRLSLGLSLNLWHSSFLSDNSWEQDIATDVVSIFGPTVSFSHSDTHEEYSDFSGENLTAGLLWTPTDKWSFGARYDSAFTGEVDYERMTLRMDSTVPSTVMPWGWSTLGGDAAKETRHVRFPDSMALGIARRFNDRLTLSLDVTRTDWDDYYVKDEVGNRFSLVDFSNINDPWTRTNFDPTYTVRFGTEYVFIPKRPDEESLDNLWTLRGGLFYDEEPATSKPNKWTYAGKGSGDPDKFYGFAVGCGLLTHQRVNIDFAYQLRYGHDVNRDFLRGVSGFKEDVLQHRCLLSAVIYF